MPIMDLKKSISGAERLVSNLKTAGKTISDSLLVAMFMQGLPYTFDDVSKGIQCGIPRKP